MKKDLPSPEMLRKLLRCDPDTGRLFWLPRTPDMFNQDKRCPKNSCGIWNSRYAGTEALTARKGRGYPHGCVLGHYLGAHRVLWALHYGTWPVGELDHINGDPADNRIVNLREVTRKVNARNTKRMSTNTSGIAGINWRENRGKWQVRISDDSGPTYVGMFVCWAKAVAARREATVRLGYHENHGRSGPLSAVDLPS
jgi:hypothetical protein